MLKVCECGKRFMTTRKSVAECRACARGELVRTAAARRRQREAKAPGSHTRAQWRTVIKNQGECCYWCGKSLRDANGKLRPEKDHLTPLSRGGTNFNWNLAAVCAPCNRDKGDMTAGEYRSYLASSDKKSTIKTSIKATATRRKSDLLESQMSLPWPEPSREMLAIVARLAASKAMEEPVLALKGYDLVIRKPIVNERRNLLRAQAQKILQERQA